MVLDDPCLHGVGVLPRRRVRRVARGDGVVASLADRFADKSAERERQSVRAVDEARAYGHYLRTVGVQASWRGWGGNDGLHLLASQLFIASIRSSSAQPPTGRGFGTAVGSALAVGTRQNGVREHDIPRRRSAILLGATWPRPCGNPDTSAGAPSLHQHGRRATPDRRTPTGGRLRVR